eukprot:6376881-Pyramimonas_sp.AAC.1
MAAILSLHHRWINIVNIQQVSALPGWRVVGVLTASTSRCSPPSFLGGARGWSRSGAGGGLVWLIR